MASKKAQYLVGNQAAGAGDSKWHWTNERHVRFLNSMEASFVQSMFGGVDPAPMDRYLPDTAESTQDLGKERRISPSPSGSSKRKTDKKTRNLPCQKSSQDQVVPQLHLNRDDNENHVP